MNDTTKVFIMVTLILLESICLVYLVGEIILKLKRGRRPRISFQPEPPAPEYTPLATESIAEGIDWLHRSQATWPRQQVDSSEPEQTPMLDNSVGDETDDNDKTDDDDELFGVFHDQPKHRYAI